jgi:hypothetical protein
VYIIAVDLHSRFGGEDCESCSAFRQQMISVTFESGSKLSAIDQKAFLFWSALGPSIQLPASFHILGDTCFGDCNAFSLITFKWNSTLSEIGLFPRQRCPLESFQIPASVLVIDWYCVCEFGDRTHLTFESPAKVEKISDFYRVKAGEFSVPDSVISLSVSRKAFTSNFGRDSGLQELVINAGRRRGVGFMRLNEPSLKRIRMAHEWSEPSDTRPPPM